MTFRELCAKEVVQLSNGACLGRADDLELDPQTAQVRSLLLLGRPHLFGLLGRDETLTIPWEEIDKIGLDAVLVRTELLCRSKKVLRSGKSCAAGWMDESFSSVFPELGFDFTENRIIIGKRGP